MREIYLKGLQEIWGEGIDPVRANVEMLARLKLLPLAYPGEERFWGTPSLMANLFTCAHEENVKKHKNKMDPKAMERVRNSRVLQFASC